VKTSETTHGMFTHRPFYEWLVGVLPEGGRVVEVGVFYGKSIIYLAQEGPGLEVYGVDNFCFGQMPYQEEGVSGDVDFYEACLKNLFEAGVGSKVTLISLPSVRAAGLFEDASLDCVFLDAQHSEEAVTEDIIAWRPKVRPGGILSGDDYIQPWGVIPAVDKLVPEKLLMGQAWYATT